MGRSCVRTCLSLAVGGFNLLASALPAQAQSPSPSPPEVPAAARALQNPMKGDGMTIQRGMGVFHKHCVPCHGTTGAGDGPMAQRLGYKPRNLTLERMNQLTDGEIFWRVSKGFPPMPAFEQELSGRERWDVVSYVRTLVRMIQ